MPSLPHLLLKQLKHGADRPQAEAQGSLPHLLLKQLKLCPTQMAPTAPSVLTASAVEAIETRRSFRPLGRTGRPYRICC